MTILESFKILQEIKKFDSLLSILGFTEEKLTPEQLKNFYFENVEKIYEFLPIETLEFLKKYYESKNSFLDDDNNFTYGCLVGLKKIGIASLSKAEIDYEQTLINLDGSEMELETACILEERMANEFFDVELDSDFMEVLFQHLEENPKIIKNEIILRDTISGILSSHLAFLFDDLCSILNKLNFEIENSELNKFLEFKMGNGVYFSTIISNQTVIAEMSLFFSQNLIYNLLELKDYRVLHSADVYRELNFHFNTPEELINVEDQLSKLNLESNKAYLIVPYLQELMLTKKSSEQYLNLLEEKLEIPAKSDLLIKENIESLLNRWPNAFEGGKIRL
ncbi:MAG: hypothetical protein ACRC7S_01335 [Cetobacterium sp.]